MALMTSYTRYFLFGLLLPLGFAPFHLPGFSLLGLALFYHGLTKAKEGSPLLRGLFFGLSFFAFGVSWVYVSIHDYGHMHGILAAIITFLFLFYLSLFPALVASLFSRFMPKKRLASSLFFSALWIASEYIRATFLSGFPWLLIGFGQFDTPVKYLLPILGVYGVGFISTFAATLLSHAKAATGSPRQIILITFVTIIIAPMICKKISWAEASSKPISVGIVQENLSMRDKWDEQLFWQLLAGYKKGIKQLWGKELIVLPESAIPLPATYISDFLYKLDQKARQLGSALLLGIPKSTDPFETNYFNTIMSLGKAKGNYFKQHLVPFGEYIPAVFLKLSQLLDFPIANLSPGKKEQKLIRVQHHPIASLVCYEVGYGDLLRKQLPKAEWIVSVSDDGWFGRSLAIYQQLQMAQVLAMEAARFHVVANNDGLSSVIDSKGDIVESLPAYRAGLLQASLVPNQGATPWVLWGDWPCLVVVFLIILYRIILSPIAAADKRRYPYEPHCI